MRRSYVYFRVLCKLLVMLNKHGRSDDGVEELAHLRQFQAFIDLEVAQDFGYPHLFGDISNSPNLSHILPHSFLFIFFDF